MLLSHHVLEGRNLKLSSNAVYSLLANHFSEHYASRVRAGVRANVGEASG